MFVVRQQQLQQITFSFRLTTSSRPAAVGFRFVVSRGFCGCVHIRPKNFFVPGRRGFGAEELKVI
jgi:hypothetical protein